MYRNVLGEFVNEIPFNVCFLGPRSVACTLVTTHQLGVISKLMLQYFKYQTEDLLGLQGPRGFEKAGRRRAFLMHMDFEIPIISDVECLN